MKKNDDEWRAWNEEITNETEHYYQGEMQQEERSSWLLGTSSALIAIFISLFLSCIENNIKIPITIFTITILLFFISAVFSVFGVLPYKGIKYFGRITNEIKLLEKNNPKKILEAKFHSDGEWTKKELKKRIRYHFRNHYLRNLKKGRIVIISSIFFFFGLAFSLVLFLILVIRFS